ncbi:MAG TPA: cytochrome c [Hyphomonadaceae bacterium]|nr:cytochrome c [Hyphomonadaceae bacterium]
MTNKLHPLAVAVAMLALVGCGGEDVASGAGEPAADHGNDTLPNGVTVKQQIEIRQKSLKEMGAAMKTIGDQMKSGAPALDQIRPAVQTIKTHAAELPTWFPAGTGPESGVKTEALAKIWEDQAGFQAAAQRLAGEAGKLSDVATGEDIAAIGAQVGATGAACKNCHDQFRMKKEQ